MSLPYQGSTNGIFNTFNSTVLPNFYQNVQVGNALAEISPAKFNAANPQVPATITATIGGTVAAGNIETLTLTQGQLPGGFITGTYDAVSGDSTADVAEGLATAFQDALIAANIVNIAVTSVEAVVTVSWRGPMGNFATLTSTEQGAVTITIPNAGVLTGGSGPVYAANNFNFQHNGSTLAFFYGRYYNLGGDLLAQMAAQDMPVV